MDNNPNFTPLEEEGACYEIKIRGGLAIHWSDWICGMQISEDERGNTNLTGIVLDQSVLHGILAQIRNLGLDLISVRPLNSDDEEAKGTENENQAHIE
jgi:hypothetical protein